MSDNKYAVITDDGVSYLEEYETYTDYLLQAEHGDAAGFKGERSSHSSKEDNWGDGGSEDWYGTKTFAEALKQAKEGWPKGREKIDKITAGVYEKTGSLLARDEVRYDVTGQTVDMGRYLTGEPECVMEWAESERFVSTHGKHVRIIVNISASAGVGAEVLYTRGAAIVALIDSLEKMGRRCEIIMVEAIRPSYGGQSGSSTHELCATAVTIKRAGEALQIDQIAFALASPSSLRRIQFAINENHPDAIRNRFGIVAHGGYGSPAETKLEGDIVLKQAHYGETQWSSVEAAQKWVIENLKEQGVTFDQEGDHR